MEREVHAVLGPVGVDERLSRQVALALLKVELDAGSQGGQNGAINGNAEPHPEDGGLRWSKDVGITAFLLKYGEGMGKSIQSLSGNTHTKYRL